MKYLLLLASLAVSTEGMHAQNVKGTALFESNEPVIGSDITLLNAADSSIIKYGYTDEEGKYEFESIHAGSYLLKLSIEPGWNEYSEKFELKENATLNVPTIIAKESSKNTELNEVVVVRKRPIVEMFADKTVLNVDSTINAVGQTALELMRKSPGVVVDKDDNLSISGKTGVRVYIDGRPSPLTGAELSEYLKTIQSSSIDAIEIITSPSAKYDAQGNAGIINIRMKKNQLVGTNGSINLGFSQGVFAKYNGGFNINHRTEKFNIFANYNGSAGNSWNDMRFERKLQDTFYLQNVNSVTQNKAHNYKVGVDYYLSDKSIIGAVINGNNRVSETRSINEMTISSLPANALAKRLVSNNAMDAIRNNINGNINYSYNNKEKNQNLVVDADYGIYKTETDQIQPNEYYNETGNFLYRNAYNIIAPTEINIFATKADWEQNLGKGRLGLGAKASFINTQNNFHFNNEIGNLWIRDTAKSNNFNYDERIQAVYGTYSQQFNGVAFQAGIRLENTITKGNSVGLRENGLGSFEPYDSTFERNYFDYFPNVGITFNKNPLNQFTLAYNKRIDRPNYQDINPFEFRMDDYNYRRGNINLKPQISHSVSLSHSLYYVLNTKLEYSRVNNVFAELLDTAGYKLFQTKENLATQDMISLNISFPYAYKNLSTFVNLNGYYSMYKADYGGGRTIDLDVFAFNAYGQVSYKINDWLSTEMSGWYTSPSVWQGTFRSIPMGGVDVGAQARVLKGKGNFKVSVGDIFRTMRWGGSSTFVGQEVYATGRWESTQVRLNFTYNFGNNKIKSRTRNTGAEDEKRRTSDGGGIGSGQGQ